jgi:hypothetical protein
MGMRGPKKLTSEQLKRRGSRLSLVKAREAEEQAKKRRTALTPQSPEEPLPMPKGLTHATAVHCWRETLKQYQLDEHAAILVTQAAFTLQRAEQARESLDSEGEVYTDAHGKQLASPLVKIEIDHRQLFARLFQQLGFLQD